MKRSTDSEETDEIPKPLSEFEEDNRFNLLSDDDREDNDKIKAEEAKNLPIEQDIVDQDKIPKFTDCGDLNSGIKWEDNPNSKENRKKMEEEKEEGKKEDDEKDEEDEDEWTDNKEKDEDVEVDYL